MEQLQKRMLTTGGTLTFRLYTDPGLTSENQVASVQYTIIYVDEGAYSSPYYNFYSDSSGANSFDISTIDTTKTYEFRRLNDTTDHPFYISDGYKKESSENITLTGDGSYNSGIAGTQTFTLTFNNPTAYYKLYYYCTSHNNMVKELHLISTQQYHILIMHLQMILHLGY